MAYADQVARSRRLSIIAGVAAVHGAIGYLFVSGMAVDIVTKFVPVLTTTNIPIDMPPPPPEPAPPPQQSDAAAMPAPRTPTATVAIVEAPASSWTVAVDPGMTMVDAPLATAAIPAVEPTPAVSRAAGPRVRGDRTSWFSTDDYPPSAIRAEEEGVVAVQLGIGTDGRVTSCTVTQRSGSSALDQATCRLYQKRARFAPAKDEAGAPVAATYGDRVTWRLPPR